MSSSNKIQDLTDQELQAEIGLYETIADHNTIARILVEIYQKELNERTS